MITITIPTPPVAWKRPAQAKYGGRFDSQKADKETIALFALEAMKGREPLDVPLFMRATFYMAKPKSRIRKHSTPYPYPDTRPDLDNFVKLCLDAMEGVVFVNDWKICKSVLEKRYAKIEAEARTVIFIRPMGESEDMT